MGPKFDGGAGGHPDFDIALFDERPEPHPKFDVLTPPGAGPGADVAAHLGFRNS